MPGCRKCPRLIADLDAAELRATQLEVENDVLGQELAEALKLIELQKADLDRFEAVFKERRPPNCPERAPEGQLQLAMARVLAEHGEGLDVDDTGSDDNGTDSPTSETSSGRPSGGRRNRHEHGRRRLDMTGLPVQEVTYDPPEVIAANGVGYRLIGAERSSRLVFRVATYMRLEIVRNQWVREEPPARLSLRQQLAGLPELALPPVHIAPLPDCLWPRFMADTSVIANVVLSKYADHLPLNRQETISGRHGFTIPRSTQCGWLGAAHAVSHRIVDAMMEESCRDAFCIATDATGAPLKAKGGTDNWHVFVFIADNGHVVFRHTKVHSSVEVQKMLKGFNGMLLADASNVYDRLYKSPVDPVTECGCWAHMRRYVWQALPVDATRACEGLAIIQRLFQVDRECSTVPMPQRTATRAARAGPVLILFERWVTTLKDADPRSPLAAVATYFQNQKAALRRFLDDARLPIHNNRSEAQLRALVLGRNNWNYFANETGLKWYTTFRSLIASCIVHKLNPQTYLEQVLRLAPHWSTAHMLELSPKYWQRTLASLSENERTLIRPAGELQSHTVVAAVPTPIRHIFG